MPKMTKHSFIRNSENISATYSWVDLADGTGGVTYYVSIIGYYDGGEQNEYILTQNKYVSDYNINSILTQGSTVTADLSPYNTPRTAKGTAYVQAYGDQGGTTYWDLKVKFQKVSNGVATDISSEVTSTRLADNAYCLIEIPLTETNFKIGDNLRVLLTAGPSGNEGAVYCSTIDGNTYQKPLRIDFSYKIDV